MTEPSETTRQAEAIRARVDAMHPRVNEDGTINVAHVAMESTLRQQHALPAFIASLDGPGKFRPHPPTIWLEAHATTHDVVQRGAVGHDGREVSHHLAVVLADAEHTVVLEGSRTRLMDMLERTVDTLSKMPTHPRADERRPHVRDEPALPTQAEAKRTDLPGLPGQIAAAEQGEWQR